jgi:membrane protein implicated in regulation of membrane protease activity
MRTNERARRAWVLYTSDPRMECGQKSYLAAVGFLFAALAVLVAIEGDWWGAAGALGVVALTATILIRRTRSRQSRDRPDGS